MVRISLDLKEDLLATLDQKIKEEYGQLIKRNAALRDILVQWINTR